MKKTIFAAVILAFVLHTAVTAQTAPANMVRIQGGTFTMGSPENELGRFDNEGPQPQVTVSSFYMGKYEVTQKEYQKIMGTNPSYFKGDNLPVEQVSWYDAVEYCNKRSQKEGLTPGLRYRIVSVQQNWFPACAPLRRRKRCGRKGIEFLSRLVISLYAHRFT